ncbi:hypothetical protein [Prevotella corporis]|uniref:Uncharacterized protein n=1 Tax=Prevotella corporis TaxID=28128 RepID=A0A133PRE4_9BACT|nr:hypothetical protein [Prevotella corporis]KXA31293.1 hypothetical protein HMPREF3226_02961 [Prevotella corporis]MDQ7737945.1 hypothetical protein [Prevotella corporis]
MIHSSGKESALAFPYLFYNLRPKPTIRLTIYSQQGEYEAVLMQPLHMEKLPFIVLEYLS